MSIQQVESWILRHALPVDSGARHVGRVMAATGVGSLALALFTIAVQGATQPTSDGASDIGIGLLLADPLLANVVAPAVLVAWVVSAALALPVLWGRRVYASGLFVLALECAAVLVSGWIDGPPILLVAIATYPVALVASRFVPSLSSRVRGRAHV